VSTLSLRIPWGTFDDARMLSYPKGAKHVVAQPIKIEERIEAEGPDIYKKHQVTRMVLALTADVRPGMSGAPLIVQGGTVAGMVIAEETDDPTRGYALAAEEVLPIANDATKATKHVSTRKCDTGQ
jgi:hypothetical protein